MTTCHHCQAEFMLKWSTARLRHLPRCWPPPAHTVGPGRVVALQATQLPGPARSGADVTLRTPIPRALPAGIVPDAKWPGMYGYGWPEAA